MLLEFPETVSSVVSCWLTTLWLEDEVEEAQEGRRGLESKRTLLFEEVPLLPFIPFLSVLSFTDGAPSATTPAVASDMVVSVSKSVARELQVDHTQLLNDGKIAVQN